MRRTTRIMRTKMFVLTLAAMLTAGNIGLDPLLIYADEITSESVVGADSDVLEDKGEGAKGKNAKGKNAVAENSNTGVESEEENRIRQQ